MKKIAVIGAGTMGAGIAQIAAEAGYQVSLRDIKDEFVERGIKTIGGFIGRKLKKEKITQEQHDEILGRVSGTTDTKEAVEGADVVFHGCVERTWIVGEAFAGDLHVDLAVDRGVTVVIEVDSHRASGEIAVHRADQRGVDGHTVVR